MSSSIQKTDFLRFSAYSIKDLITRKLAQDSKFTDQIYEGSNLAVLIDIVSYMYQCLVYQLNNAASESMFKDTQLFQNMVRLIKFLGYTPKGCEPTQINITLKNLTEEMSFFRGLYIDTGNTDSNGKKILFSTDEVVVGSADVSRDITLYNGRWTPYDTRFTASGNGNDVFQLTGLKSDDESKIYVPSGRIRVFVKEGQELWKEWEYDREGLFLTTSQVNDDERTEYISITNSTQRKFSINVQEDGTYEIRFGDGIVGKKLERDWSIFVLYLDSNGPYGDIDIQKIDFANVRLQIPQDIKNLEYELKKLIYDYETSDEQTLRDMEQDMQTYTYTMSLDTSSGKPMKSYVPHEDVEGIRENAPMWFRNGYRLITKNDYETFFKRNELIRTDLFNSNIIDVKCMNNVEYVTKFYKWLYVMGLNRKTPDGRYYFKGSFFNRNNYYFIDPSDTNNIYLWIKTDGEYGASRLEVWNSKANDIVKNIKMTTTEVNIVSPITVNFDICAASSEFVKSNYMSNSTFDEMCDTKIEITIADDVSYVSTSLQNSVLQIILQEFSLANLTLGHKVDPTNILNKIYEINGVQNVRTVWRDQNANDGVVRYIDGISLVSWTDTQILDEYEDLQVGNSSRTLEDFQFPRFVGQQTLLRRITVIKKQMSVINTITF